MCLTTQGPAKVELLYVGWIVGGLEVLELRIEHLLRVVAILREVEHGTLLVVSVGRESPRLKIHLAEVTSRGQT